MKKVKNIRNGLKWTPSKMFQQHSDPLVKTLGPDSLHEMIA